MYNVWWRQFQLLPELRVDSFFDRPPLLFHVSFFPHLSNSAERQNAELAKMRQECVKLTKEVGEKTESLLATENIRKGLEAKASAAEKQLSLMQVGPGLWGLITSL